jgi:glycosyltransferase involved in cell wall biosynthesis
MKIAYFSPFESKRTGIAAYSEELVRALRKIMRVDCFDFGNDEASDPSTRFGDFGRLGRIGNLAVYDAVLYHIGNNPEFHLDIFKTMRHRPGIVVLHDTVLYFLIAGLGRAGLVKYLALLGDESPSESLLDIIHDSVENNILRYPFPEKHPLLAAIFPYATRIIVHNDSARQKVISSGCKLPVHTIPHLRFSSREGKMNGSTLDRLRRRHHIEEGELVIACVGSIGRTKRIPQTCAALGRLLERINFRFLLVGEGDDVSSSIREAKLEARTIRTGFVDATEFSEYVALSDILVNLRYPSMGESSGTLIRALELGKPVIVTRDAAFNELPDNAVCKIDIGPNEVEQIATTIEHLARDPSLRHRLGEAARHYAETTLDPLEIARQYERVIEIERLPRAPSTTASISANV